MQRDPTNGSNIHFLYDLRVHKSEDYILQLLVVTIYTRYQHFKLSQLLNYK